MPTGARGDYEAGYGKPPRNAGLKKGQSGNPRGRQPGSKNLTTLLNDALNEPVTITENGRRRKITKREAVIKQLVNKPASADARSLKILLDLMLNLEARARASAAPTRAVGPGDEEVLAQLKARLEQIRRTIGEYNFAGQYQQAPAPPTATAPHLDSTPTGPLASHS